MKIRQGFVSNSSSTAFIIVNTSNNTKTLEDFVKENPEIIEEFKNEYDYKENPRFTQDNLLKSAISNNMEFKPKERKRCVFGDEDGSTIGLVFDYMLRDGGSSQSFEWEFDEYLR